MVRTVIACCAAALIAVVVLSGGLIPGSHADENDPRSPEYVGQEREPERQDFKLSREKAPQPDDATRR